MAEDIGESLVGAYLRYVERCEFVLFNTFLPGIQGEIDVIGIRLGQPRDIYFAEVTTHLDGMTYGGNASTVSKIRSKLNARRGSPTSGSLATDITSRSGVPESPRAR